MVTLEEIVYLSRRGCQADTDKEPPCTVLSDQRAERLSERPAAAAATIKMAMITLPINSNSISPIFGNAFCHGFST